MAKYDTYTVLERTEKILNARIRSTIGTAAFIISSVSKKIQTKHKTIEIIKGHLVTNIDPFYRGLLTKIRCSKFNICP